jgi:hypothetical protein
MSQKSSRRKRPAGARDQARPASSGASNGQAHDQRYQKFLPSWMRDGANGANGAPRPQRPPRPRRARQPKSVGGYTPGKFAREG